MDIITEIHRQIEFWDKVMNGAYEAYQAEVDEHKNQYGADIERAKVNDAKVVLKALESARDFYQRIERGEV